MIIVSKIQQHKKHGHENPANASTFGWNNQKFLFDYWLFHVVHANNFFVFAMKLCLFLSDWQYNANMYHQQCIFHQLWSVSPWAPFPCKFSNQKGHRKEMVHLPIQCCLNELQLQAHIGGQHLWTYANTTFCPHLSLHPLVLAPEPGNLCHRPWLWKSPVCHTHLDNGTISPIPERTVVKKRFVRKATFRKIGRHQLTSDAIARESSLMTIRTFCRRVLADVFSMRHTLSLVLQVFIQWSAQKRCFVLMALCSALLSICSQAKYATIGRTTPYAALHFCRP